MAVTTLKPLIQVKCLTKKMAEQIQFCQYDHKPESVQMQIYSGVKDGSIVPVGWCFSGNLEGHGRGSAVKFWLVKHNNQLYWWVPPTSGEVHDKYNAMLEQLFVA